MKKKLTMAILSLVLAVSVLSTATFAWFNLSSVVTAGQMNMTVQTGGSLYIRTKNAVRTPLGDTRSYRTAIQFSTDLLENGEGIQPVSSLYRFLKQEGTDTTETQIDKGTFEAAIQTISGKTFDFGPGQGEPGTTTLITTPSTGNALGAISGDVDGVVFQKQDKLLRAKSTNNMDAFVYAQENKDFGKWNVELMSMSEEQEVEVKATVNIAGIVSTSPSITVADMARDYLSAYRIEIYKIVQTNNTAPENYGYTYVPVVVFTVDPAQIKAITAAQTTFTNDFNLIAEYTTPLTDSLGMFAADQAVAFEVYFYIDGTQQNGALPYKTYEYPQGPNPTQTELEGAVLAGVSNGGYTSLLNQNQNHITRVPSVAGLTFTVVTPVVIP